jgi:hypothetical protein
MMMLDKTVEQLKKELYNARSALSYHKNKNKPSKRQKGESPQAKANRLAGNKAWNDNKRAMAHVIALLTANDAGYKDAYTQACAMPVDDARELTKGHEAAVEKQVKVLQEARKARENDKAKQMVLEAWPDEPKPESKPKPKLIPKPEPVQTVPVCVPLEDAKTTHIHIPIKRELLSLAQKVVLADSGFEDLSKEQVVGYILNRYLKYNKER